VGNQKEAPVLPVKHGSPPLGRTADGTTQYSETNVNGAANETMISLLRLANLA